MENKLANNDDWDLRVATSISALNDFLESQQSSLDRIREDIKKLEDLKALGMVDPVGVLRTAVNNSSEAYMRHSEVCLELEASIPGLDWSLFESAESRSATPISLPDASSSCASRIKSTMARFEQSIAALPPLPADLLDSVENKGKKRKRSELIPRDSAMPPTCRLSGGLRLPDLSHHHNSATHSLKLSGIGKLPLEPHRRSASTTNSSSGLHEPFTPTSSVDPIPQPHADYSHTERPPWASKSTGTFDAITRSTPESPPDSPMSNRDETFHESQTKDREAVFHEETTSTPPHETEELPVTFKKNWSLAEQHTLERLLSEIPSTVKFRWVKISEAMGGTRTPRQVASRVQKYYDKMKKLGVAVDLADMGGGGRGGSKAIQDSDMPSRKSTSTRLKGQSARGMPKTGPQYTKSGRRR